jgi:transposase
VAIEVFAGSTADPTTLTVSSSYLEGRCCPLAQFGYSRDGKRGKRQIVYGLSDRHTGQGFRARKSA